MKDILTFEISENYDLIFIFKISLLIKVRRQTVNTTSSLFTKECQVVESATETRRTENQQQHSSREK
jgi:hypothetical protein